jgi:hypothetical protein
VPAGAELDTPFEILALYRLRENLGLPNPQVEHPLRDTPLGRLQPVSAPWSDTWLAGVVARARREFSDL